MSRYAAGDDAAFGVVYDALAPRLFGYLRRHASDGARAEDLLQQTFLNLHRARSSFVAGAAVLPWAFAIARRLAIDASRTSRRRPLISEGDGLSDACTLDPSAEQHMHAAELAGRLDCAMALLPESQRVAFELVKRDGLSFRDAAQVLGTTVAAVKLRAQRASHSLRLAAAEPETDA